MLPDKDGPAGGGGRGSEGEDPSVSLFREYLRLRTVHPEPDYGESSSSQYTGLRSEMNRCFPFFTRIGAGRRFERMASVGRTTIWAKVQLVI